MLDVTYDEMGRKRQVLCFNKSTNDEFRTGLKFAIRNRRAAAGGRLGQGQSG